VEQKLIHSMENIDSRSKTMGGRQADNCRQNQICLLKIKRFYGVKAVLGQSKAKCVCLL